MTGESIDGGEGPLPEYDWSAADSETTFRQWRTRGLTVAVAAVAAVAVADHTDQLDVGLLVLEWLTIVAGMVAVSYLVVPLVADRALAVQYWNELRDDYLALAGLGYLLVAVAAGVFGPPLIGHPDPELTVGFQPPLFTSVTIYLVPECIGTATTYKCYGTTHFPLGTNGHGQDMLLITLLGFRVALEVALVTGAILVPIGVAVGLVAGYWGGLVDEVLMRTVDVQGAVPAFLVYLVLTYTHGRSLFLMVLVFGLLSWGKVARLVRSEVLQRREENFVLAARSAGASELYVVRNTILPNVSGTVITTATKQASTLILLEAALSFMELGENGIGSWGESISFGMTDLFPYNWWISVIPLLGLTFTVVAMNAVGDSVRDVLDPRSGR